MQNGTQFAPRQQSLAAVADMTDSNPAYNTQHMIYPQDPFEAQVNYDLSASNFYPTNPLPQLDRQMVFGAAYAGMDPSVNTNTNTNATFGLTDNFNLWDGIDVNALGMGINGNSWLGQSSTAWMMPFNTEPPQIADMDNSVMTGNFDVGNSFSGPSGQVQNHSLQDLGLDQEHLQSG